MLRNLVSILTFLLITSARCGEELQGAQLDFGGGPGVSREVLQLSDREGRERFVCALNRDEIQDVLDETSRTWRVDRVALRNEDGDLQAIVNCSEEGDTILLDVDGTVQFSNRVVIPWRLTLSGNARDMILEDGVFPEAGSKQHVGCPREDEGVFLVRARDILFANVVFEDCSLTSAEESAAIIEVQACEHENLTGSVQLHHVQFVRNRLEGSTALDMSRVSCSTLELVDVALASNICSGFCGVAMSAENHLRNTRINGTRHVGETGTIPTVLYAPPMSRTTAEDIVAFDNEGVVLYVEGAEFEISNSSFTRNEGEVSEDGLWYGAGIHLDGSTITVRRCTFEDNAAVAGGAIHAVQSNMTLRNSVFNRNEAEVGGAAVYLFQCGMVEIMDCSFRENSLPLLDGAAVFANATASLTLKRSNFDRNRAGTGGAVYAMGGSLEVEECQFRNNSAAVDAGALYFEGTVLEARHCAFLDNSAATHGGASLVRPSEAAMISSLACANNTAEYGGCLQVYDTPLSLNDSVFSGNSAAYGGGLSANTSTASIIGCVFRENNGARGGGLNLNIAESAELRDAVIERNSATAQGAGAVLRTGNFHINNCSFEGNSCQQYGGGFVCGDGAVLTVNLTSFHRNAAGYGGAGSSVLVTCNAAFFDSNWTSNRAVGASVYGGGVLLAGRATFEDSRFEHNTAESRGGVFVNLGPANFNRVVLRSNRAEDAGGAIGGFFAIANITDCYVEGNEASMGGAILFGDNSAVNVHRLLAVSNTANESGGALGFFEAAAFISESVFERNAAASSSGAVDVISTVLTMLNVTVSDSSCGRYGGAVAASTNSVVNITASSFRRNRARGQGGSLLISTGSRLNLVYTTVSSSRAGGHGGGICPESTTAYMVRGNVSENSSDQRGGGIFALNSTLIAENVTVMDNTAENGAGGIEFTISTGLFLLTNSTFLHNRGAFGGALAVRYGSAGYLNNAYALNNSALTSGGLVYVDNSNLTIVGGQFMQNRASFGGDVCVERSGRLSVRDAEFRNGSATRRGGCLAAYERNIMLVQNSVISASEADAGGAISLVESYFWGRSLRITGCTAETDGGAIAANGSSSVLCTECVFANNSAHEKGGAVHLESSKTQLLAFQFDNCSFENSRAALGGALHFVNEDRLANCTESGARCTFLALRRSEFVQNEALSAGGAILSSDLNSIRVTCFYDTQRDPLAYLNRSQFEALPVLNSIENICLSWTGNRARVYGDILASYARRVRKTIRFEETQEEVEVEGNLYFLQNHLSGSQLPSLFLTVVDALGQGPAAGSGNDTVEAVMWSPDRLFTGDLRIRLEDGTGDFSGISGYHEPGFYDVRVDFSERSIPSFTILVEMRRCLIGEAPASNGTICQQCGEDSFNFFPDEVDTNCKTCPEEAKCDTSVIRPLDGFWHGSPCSVNIQECLTKRACDADGRDERLKAIGLSVQSCNFSDQFVENYTNAECKKGYRGPLCGSCDDGFGRSRSFRCESCFGRFGSLVLLVLAVGILLLLSSFTIRSSLPSHRQKRPLTASQKTITSTSATPRGDPSTSTLPTNLEMVEMLHTGHASKGVIQRKTQQRTQTPPQNQQNVAELAKWKATEIFKITVNYLQIIAVAMAINVDWTGSLVRVFETAEFIGGVTAEAAAHSVDCLISSDSTIPRTAIRAVVNVMAPMLVTAMYFAFWAVMVIRLQGSAEYLAKRCILSFIAVSYLSYIALTKTAANVLSCVRVHDSAELGNDSATSYWSIDTSMECYEGSHTVLAALIGWPVLILFSIGFPVAVASALLFERNKHGGLKREWLFESMGFMYRAYSEEYAFWESMIMLRKAILAIVVAFSYSLGGNLQGLLCVCVLVLALYFQLVCSPFRSEFTTLNKYEGLSLLVSAMTFVSGLFFEDERTSDVVRILLSVCLVLANAGLFLFFVVMFWKTGAEYLRILMDTEGIDYDPHHTKVLCTS